MRIGRRWSLTLALTGVLAIGVAGCGGSSSAGTSTGGTTGSSTTTVSSTAPATSPTTSAPAASATTTTSPPTSTSVGTTPSTSTTTPTGTTGSAGSGGAGLSPTSTTTGCGRDCAPKGTPTVPGSVPPVGGKCGPDYVYLPSQDGGPALCIPRSPAATTTSVTSTSP